MFIIWPNKKSNLDETKEGIILFAYQRGLKHLTGFLSLVSSPNGTNNCSKSSFVQTSSMNEGKNFHTGSVKRLVKTTAIYEK